MTIPFLFGTILVHMQDKEAVNILAGRVTEGLIPESRWELIR